MTRVVKTIDGKPVYWYENCETDSDSDSSSSSCSTSADRPLLVADPQHPAVRPLTQKDIDDTGALVMNGGFIQVTLNHPRTKTFLNMSSHQQKELYAKIFRVLKNTITIDPHSDYTFEYCKSGQVHLHGFIQIPDEKRVFVLGAISDVAKKYLSLLPGSHSNFNERNMYGKFLRYRSPSICLQYAMENNSWLEYMNKAQINHLKN